MELNKKSLINTVKIISILLICFLGFRLRLQNYSSVPRPGDSSDEYANAWSGLGLIELGVPIGWSYLESDSYQPIHRYINVDNIYQTGTAHGNPFYLHIPWFDHPPGMGILTGGFAYLKGARVLEDATTVLIRKPMVYLGALNILLLFLIGYLYFNYKTGIIAALIYSVSPLIVVANRLPQAENAFIPLFLISTIFIKLFQNKSNYIYLFFSALIAGVGIWFKIPALMITASGFLLILYSSPVQFKKRFKPAIIFTLISISFGVIPLLVYGLALNPQAFFQVLFFHAQRTYGIGISAFYQLLNQSKITGSFSITDGWLICGWLSWLILLVKNKNNYQKCLISAPVFVCLIFFLFLGSESYGWYIYPFFPWLILSLAVMFNFLDDINIISALSILISIPIQILLPKLGVTNIFPHFTSFWRFIYTLYLFFVCLTYLSSNKTLIKIQKILIYVLFILGVFLSIKYSLVISPETWPSVN
ncbi:MAG: hypothetical protein US68_C0008G0077 [Candidatus Shapirobacteria bacterium GW2011_GWE1_38_10]|uniref:Glycosyltransferase RgtA/B/C/D-like domain-containing protein n=1 Tax=Candidatus Shapirobacteria bacterium GW2011_GWE1_38_10 TaxID=1618488 RepID=A0A0G0I6N0_9BACT|nr:MAG: hypothetical protein US46_C0006G0068 [Candidatus Shapirobacteria bacterium GW2011_GWF2_37_20]KKQ50192.1 MAG: hypothetical protein US68_C0008G0077 [Candidatus Shapirobacteria bacterium GW2011_GWE1_38_10]KKQ63790.1 MAG: hypothetical protein US85_C0014G0022 [Candidatus Shapirobacteria bacterium GW2011_GWF1_38_23]HBP51435.1 hypothetical protein [Candidatus Shapirobacteria bacterium]